MVTRSYGGTYSYFWPYPCCYYGSSRYFSCSSLITSFSGFTSRNGCNFLDRWSNSSIRGYHSSCSKIYLKRLSLFYYVSIRLYDASSGIGFYKGGLFHLSTHTYCKDLLFLQSRSIIHSMEPIVGYSPCMSQNMAFIGGLRKHMPITRTTFLRGILSLSVVFCFSLVFGLRMRFLHRIPCISQLLDG